LTLSLRTKLLLWNAALFLSALTLFGALQFWASTRSAERLLDEGLTQQAQDFAHRPGRRQGPMGFGGGPPDDGQQRRPPQPQNPPRIRAFGPDGEPHMGTLPPFLPSLIKESAKGRTVFGNVRIDGVDYRVISLPIRFPDGGVEVVQIAQDTSLLALAREGQIWALLVGLPFAVLASFGLATVLARLVIKPVRQLTEAAEHISENPRAEDRIPVEGEDEMARLSASFNAMTDRLQDANAELEGALRRQQRFTSDAAHELRTPLTSIALAAENGLHEAATPDEMRRSLSIVDRASKSMKKLTDVLLALARMDRDQHRLDLESVQLEPLLREALEHAGLADDPRIRWDISDARAVNANPDAVRQIVANLLENAAAYTPPDGTITLRQTGTGLEIEDTGEGISPEHLDKLFDRFYRADPSRARAKGGHGLGLSIAKALATAQGAEMGVRSTVGVGTTFFVDFRESAASSQIPNS